jgi:Zn-dependent protease
VSKTTPGWKIATVRGIDLRLDLSILFLLAYVVFVASATFPGVAERAGVPASELEGGPFFWGALFAVGLLLSVTLHEFGHAFLAQAAGIKVRGVTLMMLGGVSNIEEPGPEHSSYFEFRLAVVGPIVSFLLAGAFYLARRFSDIPEVDFYSYWLGNANLALGIFNMLPAFPLDGGRAMRSLLVPRFGKVRATQIAVKVSRVFAVGLGFLGFLGFNFLLMLIAFFIYQAAGQELNYLVSKDVLKNVRVGEVARSVKPVPSTGNLLDAARWMLESNSTALPVDTVSGSAILLLSEVNRVPRDQWSSRSVSEVMSRVTRPVFVNEWVSDILGELLAAPAGTLPVVEQSKIVGLIRSSHLAEIVQLKGLIREEEELSHKRVA